MVESDPSSVIAMAHRLGVGKVRHSETRFLWIQGKTRSRELEISKIPGTENIGDLATKYTSTDTFQHLTSLVPLGLPTARWTAAQIASLHI